MNTKEYIDQFVEISHLARHEQFVVLEKARYEAFVTLKLSWVTLVGFVMPVLFFAAFASLGYFKFGYNSWLPLLAAVLTAICSRLIMSRINRAVLKKGLHHVLEQDAAASDGK